MKVPFLDLKATYLQIQDELEEAILNSTRSGQYIGGEVVESFEKNFSNYVSSKYCIGVGNGLENNSIILLAWLRKASPLIAKFSNWSKKDRFILKHYKY